MPDRPPASSAYRAAGVDTAAGDALVRRIAPLASATHTPEVLGDLGGFGGLLRVPAGYTAPILVCGTDGVGTKLLLTRTTGQFETIGIDLVAMCANDVLTHGAKPLLFLDYYATGKLDVDAAEQVVAGIAQGCKQASCALLGGETAEMPRLYAAGDYDLAGFCVGIVEEAALLPKSTIKAGDLLIGLAASGPHANGYSLIHQILEKGPEPSAEEYAQLLTPTTIYLPHLEAAINSGKVLGLAHITGGGIDGNLPRMLPEGTTARLNPNSWGVPPVLNWIQERAGLDNAEMRIVFNGGLGMIIAVRAKDAAEVSAMIADTGIAVYSVGEVVAGDGPARVTYTT